MQSTTIEMLTTIDGMTFSVQSHGRNYDEIAKEHERECRKHLETQMIPHCLIAIENCGDNETDYPARWFVKLYDLEAIPMLEQWLSIRFEDFNSYEFIRAYFKDPTPPLNMWIPVRYTSSYPVCYQTGINLRGLTVAALEDSVAELTKIINEAEEGAGPIESRTSAVYLLEAEE